MCEKIRLGLIDEDDVSLHLNAIETATAYWEKMCA